MFSGRQRRVSRCGATLGLLALLALVTSLGAQSDEDIRRHGIFTDSVEVSLVNVEVFATRDREPVRDLTAEDFELLVDGEPVDIVNFGFVDRGSGVDAPTSEEETDPVPAEAEASELPPPATADAAVEPTTVIVLVDQLFLSPLSRSRVFETLSNEIERLIDLGATIMIAAKTRERVEIEQDFTTSPELLRSALQSLADVAPPNYSAEIRTTAELWDIAPLAVESRQTGPGQPTPAIRTSAIDAQSAFQDARGVTQRIHSDFTASLRALHRFLDALAGLPDRKALVYVADQLPVRPAELLWRIWWQEYGIEHGSRLGVTATGPSEFDSSLQLEELIADATSSRVAFYPIGTDSGPDLADASSRGVPSQGGTVTRTTASAGADGLQWLSERTGGRSARGAGTFDGFFSDLARDLDSYYSLGFVSPYAGDGESHRLEVRVRERGIQLRHPTRYRDKSAEQRMADRLLSTLMLGIESNPLDVRIEIDARPAKRRGPTTIPLEIHVPMANLVLLPDKTSHRGRLSVQLVARDDRGRLSDPVLVRLPFEVAHSDLSWALTQTVDYATEMTLADGGGKIAVGIHDDFGLVSSTLGVDIGTGSDD